MSMPGIDPSGLGRSLEEAMRLLNQATGGGAAPSGPGPAPGQSVEGLVGRGVAADGQVSAEVSAFGRLETVEIDPRLLRAGAAAVAEFVVEAVRAAQDDERTQRSSALGTPDTAALTKQLERVSEDAFRGFDRMVSDLDAITRRMDRG
ncbi:YbaB/EbfC family nucleoid-associated protein [Asanoa sp. NPDC049573]|uniref:YbaB/EbfC family nucleoid-associated protein n=1 Tax=Asanoa sp. NPDC049573 TaxID=3155396 RepID=UPI003419EB7F